MGIRIILVDDHKIIREGMASLLEDEPGLEVVGDAENGRTALRLVDKLKPQVVVMDVSMPDLNGIEAARQILANAPGVKILALSMHRDPRIVAGMLEAGAKGYLLKDCTAAELASAIRAVAAGSTYLSPQVADVVVKGFMCKLGVGSRLLPAAALSPRERQVLQLLAEGASVKEIADRLAVGVKTVETHRRNIMEKLGLYNLVDLIKYAMREGLTSLDEWLRP